jgi:hypothetical protein
VFSVKGEQLPQSSIVDLPRPRLLTRAYHYAFGRFSWIESPRISCDLIGLGGIADEIVSNATEMDALATVYYDASATA